MNLQPLRRQSLRNELVLAVAVYGAVAVALAAVAFASIGESTLPGLLSRDPNATAGLHPLAGLQSHVGVLVWWGAGVVAVFSAVRAGRGRPAAGLLLALGALSAVLAIDDLLMIHEDLAGRYLGLEEHLVLAGYALLLLVLLVVHARTLLRLPGLLLFVAAGSFFCASLLVDLLQARWPSPWRILVEDGLKLMGIVGWSAWLLLQSWLLAAPPATGTQRQRH